MKAEKFLKEAKKIVAGSRHDLHGDRHETFELVAQYWNVYLDKNGIILTGADVAMLMSLLKTARTQVGRYNEDDYVDGPGYQALAGELASDR